MASLNPTRTRVVVGVVERADGRRLMQRRPEGTPQAGRWEHPGGKVEQGEGDAAALARELGEELAIHIEHPRLAGTCAVGDVTLVVYDCPRWSGPERARIGQTTRWVSRAEARRLTRVLAGVGPVEALVDTLKNKGNESKR